MTSPAPSSIFPASTTTADTRLDMPLTWPLLMEQQQRWWTEWLEASQLWSSWWFSQWPAFGQHSGLTHRPNDTP